jgi:uncharacterized protein (DUF302 family)
MSAQQLQHSKYGFSKTVDVPYEAAVEKARAALKAEDFGVLCEIDLKEKLKEKLGVDFRNYVILGACNPPMAYKALQQEIGIGLLLPCNVIVYEADEVGKSVVAAIDAKTMLSVVFDFRPGPPSRKAVTLYRNATQSLRNSRRRTNR